MFNFFSTLNLFFNDGVRIDVLAVYIGDHVIFLLVLVLVGKLLYWIEWFVYFIVCDKISLLGYMFFFYILLCLVLMVKKYLGMALGLGSVVKVWESREGKNGIVRVILPALCKNIRWFVEVFMVVSFLVVLL